MKTKLIMLAIFLSIISLCREKIEGSTWSLSKDEDMEIQKQLKLLNKPATKTIRTKFGDIYDCVDFYNQPAFDNPLLKNETFNFEVESTSSRAKRDQSFYEHLPSFGLQGEGCPIGTVPIRRITKEYLIREKFTRKREIHGQELPDIYVHVAMARTIFNAPKYYGAGGILSIHNPNATGQQYSSSRILILRETDVIQVGWRVDPLLYGDSQTRLYIRTDTGNSHCFGLHCSGFILTNSEIPIDGVFPNISVQGGPTYDIQLDIKRDLDGNWRLRMGPYDRIEIGYWPHTLFNGTGLSLLANRIEWGGEVYSPPPIPKPPMGNGLFPSTNKIGPSFIRQVTYRTEQQGHKVNAVDANAYADDEDFLSFDLPYPSKGQYYWGHLVLYGGPGGKPI